jgi:hypothetical protein
MLSQIKYHMMKKDAKVLLEIDILSTQETMT